MLRYQIMILGVQKHSLVAARVIKNSTAEFLAVFAVDHKGPNGIRSVINTEGEGVSVHLSKLL